MNNIFITKLEGEGAWTFGEICIDWGYVVYECYKYHTLFERYIYEYLELRMGTNQRPQDFEKSKNFAKNVVQFLF